MSTTDSARTRRLVWWGTMLVGLAVILAMAAVTDAGGEPDAAAGILTGGLLVLALAVVARFRSVRRGLQAATASRVVGGEPDERDRLVYQRAAAAVGVSAFVATPVATVAHLLGADAESLLEGLPWVFIVVGVVSFVVIDRRS